ncbi:MAG TPA: CYTH and CHAD domain-containing protein [Acidimicrobiales bacterium]|nr:CYTH and CHAD domain-containing protein [Acidimicrobiales bacterium]
MRHLEQEVKLEVGPGWTLPDLSGAMPGVRVVQLAPLDLEATYYDTADLSLGARQVTFRYRQERSNPAQRRRAGGAASSQVSHVWTVKLPSSLDGGVLTRTEVSWEAPKPRSGAPLADAVQLLAGVTLGAPLRPIARLSTKRQRSELRTSDGRVLAEVDHDSVTGTSLLLPKRRGRPAPAVTFTEVEVELADGSALEVLEALSARLIESGAVASSRKSKLMTVLSLSQDAAGEGRPGSGTGDGRAALGSVAPAVRLGQLEGAPHPQAAPLGVGTGSKPAKKGRATRPVLTMAAALEQQGRACLDALLERDLPLRLEEPDPEHVHKSRVAIRRLRSLLRAFKPLVGANAFYLQLREELSWLGRALGDARDADVRLEVLQEACSELDEQDAGGARWVLQAAEEDREQAHRQLLEAMKSDRYVACLRLIGALGGSGPGQDARGQHGEQHGEQHGMSALAAAPSPKTPTRPAPNLAPMLLSLRDQPASTGMPALAGRQLRVLRKKVRRLGPSPSEGQLHRVRIEAKRFRYIAEAAAPFLSSKEALRATATGKAATMLQDVLGEAHDAAVNAQWLREVASRVPASPRSRQQASLAAALTAGLLVAAMRELEVAKQSAWKSFWKKLDDDKLLHWATTTRGATS